jgi:hypothetical protein
MTSFNIIHDSSPSGKDIQYTFSTIQDGTPLDFDNFPTFQFDVFDGSDGGRFDQDGTKLITNIVSTADPALVGIYPSEQTVTVIVPWDKDPVYDGGAASGIHQYNPAFKGEIYVFLTINMPDVAQARSHRDMDIKPFDPVPAAIYRSNDIDVFDSKIEERGLVRHRPDDEQECYGIIDPDPKGKCLGHPEIWVKPIKANYLSGCPQPGGIMRSSVTFDFYWLCDQMCPPVNDDTPGATYAIIPYVVKVWLPEVPGINPCPPSPWMPPAAIAGGFIFLEPCYKPAGPDEPIEPQRITIAPGFCDGISCSPGIPSYNYWSKVGIDFGVPVTQYNRARGACTHLVHCERECACPVLRVTDLDECSADPDIWKVPSTLAGGGLCCEGCESEDPNTFPFEDCQVMYKGYRNACSSAGPCSVPTFSPLCNPDLYRSGYWSPSDILDCSKKFNFWLRLSDIE